MDLDKRQKLIQEFNGAYWVMQQEREKLIKLYKQDKWLQNRYDLDYFLGYHIGFKGNFKYARLVAREDELIGKIKSLELAVQSI